MIPKLVIYLNKVFISDTVNTELKFISQIQKRIASFLFSLGVSAGIKGAAIFARFL